MDSSLTVVIPSYDLMPIFGPLGMPREVCEVIRERVVVCTMDSIDRHLGGLKCMYYSYSVAHDPPPSESRRIRNKGMTGFAVWYGAVASPVFNIGRLSRQQIEHYSSASFNGPTLTVAVLRYMTKYINRVSEIMDVDYPPIDFDAALLAYEILHKRNPAKQPNEDDWITDIAMTRRLMRASMDMI